jgi:hypothetical protein
MPSSHQERGTSFSGDAREATKEAGLRRTRLSILGFATAVVTMVFLCAASSAFAARPLESQITGTCPSPGTCTPGEVVPFASPMGLALDGSDDLWVADPGSAAVDKFDASGAFITQSTGEGNLSAFAQSVAFSDASSHAYVADSNQDDVWVLNSDGSYLDSPPGAGDLKGPWGEGCCFIRTAADNSIGTTGGDIYVAGGTNNEASQPAVYRIDGGGTPEPFSATPTPSYIEGARLTGTPAGPFPEVPTALAVGPGGSLLVATTGAVYEFDPSGEFVREISAAAAPLSGISAVAVDPTDGDILVAAESAIYEFSNAGAFLQSTTEANGTPPGPIAGLVVDSTGRLYAVDSSTASVDVFGPPLPEFLLTVEKSGPGSGYVFSEPTGISCGSDCAARFNEGSVVKLTANPATGSSFSGWSGACSGTDSCEVAVSEAATVTANFTAEPISSGCPNEAQRLGASILLPDCRAFEAVSPVATEGPSQAFIPSAGSTYFSSNGEHGIFTGRPFEVAADGRLLSYPGDSPPNEGTGNGRALAGNAYLGRLGATGLWEQVNIQPPGKEPEYLAFSVDLSVGILQSPDSLSPTAPPGYKNLYTHQAAGAGGSYDPLFTVTPPNRSAIEFGPPLLYAGANAGTGTVPSASQLLFEANDLLIQGSGPLEAELQAEVEANIAEGTSGMFKRILYASVDGTLHVVSILPDGSASANGSFGSPPPTEERLPGLDHVISTDGSRVFWTDAITAGLYVRQNPGRPESTSKDGEGNCVPEPERACTIQLDLPNSDAVGGGGGGRYLTASADGSRVFFTDLDSAELTADTQPGSGPNLYEYDFDASPGHHLTDLTAAPNGGVLGYLGSSEDGSYLYFVATGALASNRNANGEEAEEGAENLYLRHAGATIFIAKLARSDNEEVVPFDLAGEGFESGDWQPSANFRTAQVTPDGRNLIFLSNRSLTGYQNEQTAFNPFEGGGREVTTPLDEVFLYQATPGKLSCVSCDPAGAPPVPTEFNRYRPSGGTPIGAYFPITKAKSFRPQPRVITDGGTRVFFDSGEPLVPQDTNGWMDVYEWEGDGTGSCHRSEGCVYLLSGGIGAESSYLLGAGTSGSEGSEQGDDAFIITREQLVAADGNEDFDVYDARVNGVSPPAEARACQGEACRGAVGSSPAGPLPPGSSLFSGPANPPPLKCKKGQVKKHGKCVKQKAKRHKGKHHKKKGRPTR